MIHDLKPYPAYENSGASGLEKRVGTLATYVENEGLPFEIVGRYSQ